MENFKKIKAYRCNLMRFEAYSNRKIKVNLRLNVSSFFLWKSTQFTRILVESSNVHFFFKTLVYMQSVTLIPRYFIQKYYLTMSNEKSFGEFIDNTISKRQIVIHQRAFIYDKLLFSFPF